MEQIYLKNGDHVWHTGKVDLSKCLKSFSASYCSLIRRNNMSLSNIFESVLGESYDLDKKEMVNFVQDMRELRKKFKTTLPSLETFKKISKKKENKPKVDIPGNSNNRSVLSEKSLENQHGNFESKETNNASQENSRHNPQEQADNALEEISMQNPQGQADHELQENSSQNLQVENSQEKCVTEKIKEIYNLHRMNSSLSKPSLNILKLRQRIKTKKAKYKKNILTPRSELLLNNKMDKSDKKNLRKGRHFIVSFRIHEPFYHRGEKSKVEHFQQEIQVLGHQTLTELRDKIICQSDFQDVRGDVSRDPDSLVTVLTRNKYKSAIFYFDNTFYIDERGTEDYSEVIRKWALPRGINVGDTSSMGTTRVSDLKIRFGYPYVYMHQGSCEHLVIISDARLLCGKDSLNSDDYPLISCIPRPITKYCYTCFKTPAKWIVVGCERLPQHISYMCKKCFKSYNYVGNKKVGNFKAYRFFQKNLLL